MNVINKFVNPLKILSNSAWRLNRSYSSASNEEVVFEKLGDNRQGVVVVGLNRAAAKNAFGQNLTRRLSNIISDLQHNKEVKVVILRSLVPGIFCAGADLKERKKQTPDEVVKFVSLLKSTLIGIEQLPMPVIAAVDGPALGGGLEMALACDIRIASNDAKLGLVETRLAIIPGAGGTQRLPRIVGPSIAKELIFTSRVMNGKEAKELGVVNHVVDQNGTKDAAFQKALQIADEIVPNGPVGVRMAKKAIDKGLQIDLAVGYAIEEACYAQVMVTKDRLEGLQAFAEKRKPIYKGE
ncbi:methylglutaconyl-CoA hydratase, mitochondrial [Condylostylus longicornis]|uniref:methylglutaconyl-CoA hydratase, mitochondrial n=1 Tax=Condylostylus longicornis TaxID=2530218 RepID=UPI00244E1822|nr:methylglutaconyl-CoA hydratase, mitochondrial [Condylostylus longicornis]